MAELLFELGMRLKGSEFVLELSEAAEEKVEEKYEQVSILGSEPKTERPSSSESTSDPTKSTLRPPKARS